MKHYCYFSLLIFLNFLFAFIPTSILSSSQGFRGVASVVAAELSPEKLKQLALAITVAVEVEGSRGSGILIAKKGQTYTVVTNAHVVNRGKVYRIQTSDRKIHTAQLKIKGDSFAGNDLALLEFQASDHYAIAKLGNAAPLSEKETVYAAGYPFESGTFTFNSGNISLLPDKPLVGGYQIGFTSETQQGMSGGPLLNNKGETIGVLGQNAAAILNDAYVYQDGSLPNEQQIRQMRESSFAIPIATVSKEMGKQTQISSHPKKIWCC